MIEWWTAQNGNLIGAIGGASVGVLGGCLGAAAGVLAPRGKGRGLIMGSMAALVVAGVMALGFGLFALMMKQPYHVWYPLVLGGGLITFIMLPLMPVINMRYRQAEARRMDAEGIRRS